MLAKAITIGTIIAGIGLAFVLHSVPLATGPVGILAVFFLLYVVFVGVLAWGGYAIGWVIEKLARQMTVRRPLARVSLLHSYYLASVVALGPIILLGINTVSRVGLYEFGLVALFVSIGIFYVQKRLN